jgi:hypothetical protein
VGVGPDAEDGGIRTCLEAAVQPVAENIASFLRTQRVAAAERR